MLKYITPDTIANEIRLSRSQYGTRTFLVIEGEITDKRFYENLIDTDLCEVVPAYNKESALSVLKILGQGNVTGVIGILDADFWRLDGKNSPSPNTFITDTHDLETMLLKSPALDKLLNELGSTSKINKHGRDIRLALLDIGRPIGYLRWISIRKGLSLKFEGVKFTRFMDMRTLALDTLLMITKVKIISGKHDLRERELLDEINRIADKSHDPWDLCCGHDLVCILSIGLRKIWGTNNSTAVKAEKLEQILRIAYEASYFISTQLYASLRAWQDSNKPYCIFKG